VALQPLAMFSQYSSPRLPPLLLGDGVPRWFKRFQFGLTEKLIVDRVLCPELNRFRKELGLAPVARVYSQWWLSPQRVVGLFPEWFASPQPDWPGQVVLTDFPLWDESSVTEELPGLREFLERGEPPILFTAGSAMIHGREFFETAVQCCRRLGRRGLLLTRYAEQIPNPLPPEVVHFSYIPFSQVLSQAAAIVHHGGIGTLSQALAAGVPQLVMPMSHDQPDNAARLVRMGVGATVSRRRFTVARAARALDYLLSTASVHAQCRYFADKLRDVDGPALAVDALEEFAGELRVES